MYDSLILADDLVGVLPVCESQLHCRRSTGILLGSITTNDYWCPFSLPSCGSIPPDIRQM